MDVSSHSVPLLSEKLSVEFFPDFTDVIVPDLTNVVYFEVTSVPRNPSEEPTFVKFNQARIKNSAGETITTNAIAHIHNGRGKFEFKPEKDQQYTLEVKRTEKSDWQSFNIPKTVDSAPLITARLSESVQDSSVSSLSLTLESKLKEAGRVNVTLFNKFDLLAHGVVKIEASESSTTTTSQPFQLDASKV